MVLPVGPDLVCANQPGRDHVHVHEIAQGKLRRRKPCLSIMLPIEDGKI
jgi:hypothetical protein